LSLNSSLSPTEAELVFAYIFSRIKQSLVEGFSFTVPGFGAFVRRNDALYFMPAAEIDSVLKNERPLDVIAIEKRKGKLRRSSL
jgi:hypothetical protein